MKKLQIRFTPIMTFCLLTACGAGNVKLWPFDGDKPSGGRSGPANATEFNCEAGKRFYLRHLDNGTAVWVILPEREIRLDKSAIGNRYTNGIAILELNGNEASLKDGEKITYTGCKMVGKSN